MVTKRRQSQIRLSPYIIIISSVLSKCTYNGFYRRFLIDSFNVQIPKNKINPNLAKDIISNELPGIMNWVLKGRERLRMNGKFTDSPVMNKTLEEYRQKGSKKYTGFFFLHFRVIFTGNYILLQQR